MRSSPAGAPIYAAMAGRSPFPAGGETPRTPTCGETALREAEEEIGLTRAAVRLLGELAPVSTFVTNYVIHPYVGEIPAGLAWQVSEREVDAVLELPLRALRESRTRTRIERRGISFETDAYIVDEHLIWGATARIVEQLLERADRLLPASYFKTGTLSPSKTALRAENWVQSRNGRARLSVPRDRPGHARVGA